MKEMKQFIRLVDNAVLLGLEIAKDKNGNFCNPSTKSTEITIEVYEYKLTSWNGYNQGHGILSCFTIEGANKTKEIIDLNINDTNQKRYTEVKKDTCFADSDYLNSFIKYKTHDTNTEEK